MAAARCDRGCRGRRGQPRPRRARDASHTAALARRLGGDLLRARRLRARLAGRGSARGRCRLLHRPARRSLRAHVPGRPGRPRVPRVRNESSDRVRLAASLGCGAARLAVGRGPDRRSVGHRGAGGAPRVRRPGAAPAERGLARAGRAVPPARGRRRCEADRAELAAGRRGTPERTAALPLGVGGSVHRARRGGNARALAVARRRGGRSRAGGHPGSRGPRRRAAGVELDRTRVPRRAERRDAARVRHEPAERHLLLPTLEQDLLVRRRRDRPGRVARLPRTASPTTGARLPW